MEETNRPYDLKHHYYMYDIGWLIDKIQAVSDELGQAIDLRTIHYADPINWDITTQYQANTVVVDNKTGVAYISSKNVPAGVLLTNTEYWNPIFNYNDAINKLMSTIAYNEQDSPTATAAHAKGSFIYSNAVLYQAIKDIADGDALKVGSNIQLAVLSDSINTAIEAVVSAAREAIAAEATARSEAIAAEATARSDSDDALSRRIDAEATARADADANYTGTNRVSTVTGNDTRTAGDITDTADNVVIHGKKSILMDSDGTYTEDITGKKKVTAEAIEETYQSTRSIHVAGAQTEAIDLNATKSIGGTYSKTVTGVTTETYNAARSITGTNSTESYTGKKIIAAQDIQFTPESGAITYSKPTKAGDLITIPFKDSDGEVYKVLCEGTKLESDIKNMADIRRYGAKGDGTTDDTAAFNACMHENKTVYLPNFQGCAGYVLSEITLTDGQSIQGENLTPIRYLGTGNFITLNGNEVEVSNLSIRFVNKGRCFYRIGGKEFVRLHDIVTYGASGVYHDPDCPYQYALTYISHVTGRGMFGPAFYIKKSFAFLFMDHCTADNLGTGATVTWRSFDFYDAQGMHLTHCEAEGGYSDGSHPVAGGFVFTNCQAVWMTDCFADYNDGTGIYAGNGCQYFYMENCGSSLCQNGIALFGSDFMLSNIYLGARAYNLDIHAYNVCINNVTFNPVDASCNNLSGGGRAIISGGVLMVGSLPSSGQLFYKNILAQATLLNYPANA